SIHTAIVDNNLVAPDAVEDLIAGQCSPGMTDEELQQSKLFASQRDLLTVAKEFVRGEIEFALAELKYIRSRRLLPAQKRLRGSQQRTDPERLCDVIIRPQLKSAYNVLFLSLGREHDDRHLQTPGSERPTNLIAIHFRKHDVEEI